MSNKVEVNTVKPEVEFFKNEELYRLIDTDVEKSLDDKVEGINKFFIDNPSKDILEFTEPEKDEIYKKAQNLLNEYKDELTECSLNFHLNRPQYRFLTDLLLKRMEYDVNQVFIAIELTNLLGTMKEASYKNDTDLINFTITPTNVTYVYHLISTYKVKGLTKEAYSFSQVLLKIGELSRLISYYDSTAKNLIDQFTRWSFEFSPVDPDEVSNEFSGILSEAIAPNGKTMINTETGEVVVETSDSTN
jgi:hypothetical protein